ncbi:hypothetical protein [Paenibacillus radicis (ex Xue et al. 2023)]|uniref:Uncharacterized protein n=1 Tax=Paenibacillus radicis (ex Xue et al. 2023) TaxID=2972489 RepID=A0ABT1YNV5_9BACL|nr:hypothetical protein [Paenibacillus radicis (ex Xue et al. 2023)]MCR8634870.1 hypothetical protein [Paenibacillus radicis (ex Xue et al. 2023)]
MSEFTVGTLFLKEYFELISSTIKVGNYGYHVHELNERWIVMLMEDEYLSKDDTYKNLYVLSEIAPLLYFSNAEDHEWGYKIFHNKQIVASFNLSYELKYQYFLDIAQTKYPDEDPHMLDIQLTKHIYNEIDASNEFIEQFNNQFKDINVEQFQLFGVNVEELRDIFNYELLRKLDYIHDVVEDFKRIVEIEEMEWINNDSEFER